MIKTNPPLDDIEKFFEHMQEQILEVKKTVEPENNDPNLDPTTKFIFATLHFMYLFMYNQAGLSVGNIKIIKKFSEMIDKGATKDELKGQVELLEKRVVDTLEPMDNLFNKVKEAQDKKPEYIG